MKKINVLFASFLLISNGFANPGNDFVKKNEYLSKFETLDLEKSNYADKEYFEVYTDDRPQIGEGVKVFSGDTMVLQRIGKVVPCIVPMETWRRTIKRMVVGEMNFVIAKGRKLCQDWNNRENYISDYSMLPSMSGPDPSGQTQTAVVWEKKGKFNFAVGGKANWVKKGAVEGMDFKYTKAFKSVNTAFQRSIEYSGRSDDLLTFVYSEFKDGLARDAFTREFTIDLNEGNIGGFKGAIFEVLEATNFVVAYRVIRHFPPTKD